MWIMSMDEVLSRGETALDAGRLREALGEYVRITGLLPNSMAARGGLGLTLFQMGRLREAIPHLEFALSRSPTGRMRFMLEESLARARGGTGGLVTP